MTSKEKKASESRTSYSDKDLKYFKEIILKKRQESVDEVDCLRGQLTNDNRSDLDNDKEYSFHLADAASVSTDREYVFRMIDRQERLIGYLDRALERIDDKTYGVCRVTGKLIPKERLEVIPHTELSIEGKMKEKQQGRIINAEEDVDLLGL